MVKIAIMGDSHLGYSRFEKDSFIQFENALTDANSKADLILIAGDIFDMKNPRMEIIERAIILFKKIKTPIVVIHGNHERRSRDMTNILKLLDSGEFVKYLHNQSVMYEINEKKINIVGLGNIPAGYVKEAITSCIEKNKTVENYFNIIMLHQNINELIVGEDELSLQDIDELPFDLVINGHIHKKHIELNGKLIIPGSTVVTQLKEGEQSNRGYFLFDLDSKTYEFIEIECRKFNYVKLEFGDCGLAEIYKKVENEISNTDKNEIKKIVLIGSLKEGIRNVKLNFEHGDNIFIENKIEGESLKRKIDKIKRDNDEKISVRELAIREIENRAKDKVYFDPLILFEKLTIGIEEAEIYLKKIDEQTEINLEKKL